MGPGWQRCERPGSVRKRGRLRTALGAWAAGLALVAASCTSSGPASSNGDRGSDASAAPVALECETQGYPCSLPEVPAEIIERSDSLAGEALDRLEAGGRVADVAAWLMSHEGMAEVEADEAVIRFRLNGGRGTWIVRNAALGTRSSAGSGGAADGTLDRGPGGMLGQDGAHGHLEGAPGRPPSLRAVAGHQGPVQAEQAALDEILRRLHRGHGHPSARTRLAGVTEDTA